MERLKSLGSILILILILAALAVFAVIWPVVTQSLNFSGLGNLFGGATRPSVAQAPIVITVPEPVASMVGTNELVFQGFIAFAVLTAIVLGGVVAIGLVISLLMKLGGKFTTQVAADETYQKHVADLDAKEKETLKTIRESAPEPNKPDGYTYGLDPTSFSLLVLFFVATLGALIYGLVSPSGEITMFGQTFNSGLPLLLALILMTIPILAWRVRRNRLDAITDNDDASIPWDFIAVLITGLLVVGIGLGIMLYINRPL